MKTLKEVARTVFMAALILVLAVPASAQDKTKESPMTPEEAKAKQAYALGVQAYLWGYPMVVMQKSRDAMTKGGDSPVTPDQFNQSGLLFAPVNQVASAWGMLGPKFSAVQSGNSDTQYSVTWFDSLRRALCPPSARHEGSVLHIPVHRRIHQQLPLCKRTDNGFPGPGLSARGARLDRDRACGRHANRLSNPDGFHHRQNVRCF